MGFLKKLKDMGGAPSKELLQNGLLGRGVIVSVEATRVATGPEGFEKRVCVVTLEVALDNTPVYQASVRHAFSPLDMAQLVPGHSVLAVRVDPSNPQEIALDLATEPPTVTIQGEGASAADVLAQGDPVRAVIVQTNPLGMKNQAGVEVHTFVLTVLADGQVPRQVQVGNPVPPEAVPLLYPGANVPAKVLASEPDGVVIDWAAALAEFHEVVDDAAGRYLDLLSACLTRELFLDQERRDVDLREWPGGRDAVLPVLRANGWRVVRPCGDAAVRAEGRDWPPTAETMVGAARLANVRWCAETALDEDIPGDFAECGVWRGGVLALLRGVLAAHGVIDRTVWGADSFEGLPVPDVDRFPEDEGYDWSDVGVLKVGREDVEANLARYGLLDEQVRLLQGWFEDTLPSAPIERLAVLRIDGDLYQSTMDALVALEPRVAPGGFVIIDDYHGWIPCQRAVDDYRAANDITASMTTVDWTAVWWRTP